MTGNEILDSVKSLPEYKRLIESDCVSAVIVAGSLARGSYIDGWSDIDLQVVLKKSPGKIYFETIRDLVNAVKRELGDVKVGIESVDSTLLNHSMHNEHLTGFFYKYLKPYFERENKPWLVLYQASGFVLPNVTEKELGQVNFELNLANILNHMYKYMADDKAWISKKSTFRKIIKNVQLLVSGYQVTKHGYVSDNFEEVLDMDSMLVNMVPVVRKYFSNRESWSNIKDQDILDSDIESAWSELLAVAEYYKAMI
jgi:predicted nucleotidyltransferase